MIPFVWRVRVYWEDTDAGGVVYHSQYLNFFERARTEWLRDKGVHQAKIAAEENVLFAIRHMDINFDQAARLDDELLVEAMIDNVGRASLTFRQRILRHPGDLISKAAVKIVCLDGNTFRPTAIPGNILEKIQDAQH